MHRICFTLLIVSLLLAGCGGPPPDTTVADPPGAKPFEKADNAKINQLVDGWKSTVPAEMQKQKIKPETIEERVYQSSANVQEIADFYKTLTGKGWHEVPRMPGVRDGILLTGYEIGSTTLVINAVDAKQLGGDGVLIYTVKGSK